MEREHDRRGENVAIATPPPQPPEKKKKKGNITDTKKDVSRWNNWKEKLTFDWKKNKERHEPQPPHKNKMKTHTFDTSTHAKIPCACQRKWNCHFFNHRKALRLPHKINVPFNEEKIRTTMNHDKRQKKPHFNTSKNARIPRACQQKWKRFFWNIFFTTIAKHRACHAECTCSNSLLATS